MTPQDDTPSPPAPTAAPHAPGGLLTVALILLLAAAIGAAAYGVRFEIAACVALALQFALALTTVWGARDAEQLRKRTAAMGATAESQAAGNGPSPPDEGAADDLDLGRRELDEARSMHFLFLAAPAAVIGLLAAFRLWRTVSALDVIGEASAAAIVLCIAACVWHALARLFVAIPKDQFPESAAVGEAFRESMWATLAAGAGLLVGPVAPAVAHGTTVAILVWVLAVSAEQAMRAVAGWSLPPSDRDFRSPVNLLLREVVLLRSNPIASLFSVVEQRFGLSLRSTWAITFIRLAVRPAAILLALFVWGISGLAVVDTHQWGVREAFGRVVGSPLPPGLHVSLPWPFGRIRCVPVATVSTMQLGFRDDQFSGNMVRKAALLWTKPHDEEFALVLGTGTELVAINAVVYFKIAEETQAFLDYVYRAQAPEQALEAFAYRVLMEETRSQSLAEILSRDREEFVNRVLASLRRYAAVERLGLQVIDVALVNLHPPVEAAAAYLDTISAGIDADRAAIDARGRVAVEQRGAEQQRHQHVSAARIDADRRLASASAETSRFRAAREVYEVEGPAFQSRLTLDALGELFRGKRLVLVDRELARNAGEVLLDLRDLFTPAAATTPSVEAPQP